jgi:hypothetical protein
VEKLLYPWQEYKCAECKQIRCYLIVSLSRDVAKAEPEEAVNQLLFIVQRSGSKRNDAEVKLESVCQRV